MPKSYPELLERAQKIQKEIGDLEDDLLSLYAYVLTDNIRDQGILETSGEPTISTTKSRHNLSTDFTTLPIQKLAGSVIAPITNSAAEVN